MGQRRPRPGGRPVSGTWSSRDDVSRDLEESHGWVPESEDQAWRKNGARWYVTLGDSRVTASGGAYMVTFDFDVPAHVIVATCEAVAAANPASVEG